ncbi:peptidase family M1-domain-containing protein [Fimicolochytrium jonesii]|uniref:peptidase family M1-domain-containing protein n=1 Tax=Fimicolochytrium jonesii TaxID=1396493 RepID=UPI0022FDC2E9|nr:peptidase family M1-domain-containing protein [Fimicolochytrium jonesii]KAI8823190.1 peptidase family M1-domain-containing protein [Fimicolochytrium jonesii]
MARQGNTRNTHSPVDSEVTLDILPTTRPEQPPLEWEPCAPLRVSPRVAELVEPFSFVIAAAVYSWLMVAGVKLPDQLLLSTATIPGFVLLGFAVVLSPLLFLHLYIKYGRKAIGNRHVVGVKKPVTIINPGLEKASNAVIRLGLSAAATLCAGYGRSILTAVLASLFALAVLRWYFIDIREAIPGNKANGRWQKPIRAINVETGRIELLKCGASTSYAALPSAALTNAERNGAHTHMQCACGDGKQRKGETGCIFSEDFGVAAPLVCIARGEARVLKCKYLYIPRLDNEVKSVGNPAKRRHAERKTLIDSTRALRFKNARAVIIPILGCPAIVSALRTSLSARKRPWYRRLHRPWFRISVHNTVEHNVVAGTGTVTPTCDSIEACWENIKSEIDMQFSDSFSLQELMYPKVNVVVFGGGHQRGQLPLNQTSTSAGYCDWIDGLHSRQKGWRSACAGTLYTELVRRNMNDRSTNERAGRRFCLQELADIYATRAGWIDLPPGDDKEAFRRLLQAFSTTGDTTLLVVPAAQLPEGLGALALDPHTDLLAGHPLNVSYGCILKPYPEFDTQGQRVLILVTSANPLLPGDDPENPNPGLMQHNVCGHGILHPAGVINNSDARWYISPTFIGDLGYVAFQMMTEEGGQRDARLAPDLSKLTFGGVVDVKLDVKEETNELVCNAKELTFTAASVTSADITLIASSITVDEKAETVTFKFPSPIEAGSSAVLHVEYSGIHNDKMVGFFHTNYTDEAGNKKFLVATHLQATYCRQVLPCWDEPNLKSTFEVILVVDDHLTALSNMHVIREMKVETGGATKKAVYFATTPLMSTYFLAFAVGELEYIEGTANPPAPSDAVPVLCRIYATPGNKVKCHFSLDVCVRTLEFFSEYFDIAYPLRKMDFIAVPGLPGAMENWGLVTYGEMALFVDETLTSSRMKQMITSLIGHELAHQWFGNLTTMDWWSDLWLNEGFATFAGWTATNHLFPEWKVWSQFLADDYAAGKNMDALESSHPIAVEVNSPSEISSVFDAITYSKGASVVRMLDAYLGPAIFRNGIREYLKKYQMANATTAELWYALFAASGCDVASLMKEWTCDVGYPVVQVVSESVDTVKGELSLELEQSRFLSSGHPAGSMKEDSIWWIPLLITTHLDSRAPTQNILSERKATVTIPYSQGGDSFWKLNQDSIGFYCVNLTAEQLARLATVIRDSPDSLTVEDKWGVLSDAFALALAGQGSTVGALELLKSFEFEEDYTVLKEVASRIDAVLGAWVEEADEVINGLKAIKGSIFSPKFGPLGMDYPAGEDHMISMKRTLVIESAARAGDADVISALRDRFERLVAGDESALSPNLRLIAFEMAIYHSSNPVEDFESVLKIFQTARAPDQRAFALRALGCTGDERLVDRLLNDIVLDADVVQVHEGYIPLVALANKNPNSRVARRKLWEFGTTKWDTIYARYKEIVPLLADMFVTCFSAQVGENVTHTVQDWISGKGLDGDAREKRVTEVNAIKRPVEQALESVQHKTAWVKRDGPSVARWIKAQAGSS